MRRQRQAGSAIVEFTMTGVPLIFIWISIVQMSLGMWNYHTMQYATKLAGEYVQVHGGTDGYCKSNTCQVQNVATVLATAAVGLQPSLLNVSFYTISSSDHLTQTLVASCLLSACESNTTNFPNEASNSEFAIKMEYQFNNALVMYALSGRDARSGARIPAPLMT
jgi:hypothetical protein